MQTTTRQRPLGISILSIILIVFGVLALLAAILGIVALSAVNGGAVSAAVTIALIIGAILSIANIVVGWGLWTLKRWAFWTAVIVEVINLLYDLYSWLGAHNSTAIISLVVALVILIYLFADRNVRAAFAV